MVKSKYRCGPASFLGAKRGQYEKQMNYAHGLKADFVTPTQGLIHSTALQLLPGGLPQSLPERIQVQASPSVMPTVSSEGVGRGESSVNHPPVKRSSSIK